jgi:hypothetical protein
MDVLPLQEKGATGTYQLAIQTFVWNLVNEDRTLAARGVLAATNCTAKLTLEDGAGVFATILARRDDPGMANTPFLIPGKPFAPAYLEVTGGGRTYRIGYVEYRLVNRKATPQPFRLSSGNGERVDFRFLGSDVAEVSHRNPRVFDERTLATLPALAMRLPDLLGLRPENDMERARRRCT